MAKKPSKKKASEVKTVTQSLAVKYRPRTFEDLVGHENAVAVLRGMVKTKKYPGAILITGTTGTGKTTLARIIATYMNAGKVLEDSDSFRLAEKHPDFININAAETGKVDDIRTLIRGSKAAPYTNFRVICIDEAHQLTGASAEALLVPLEEPTPSTMWILCTTDPQKLKATVANRCTRIELKPIEPKDIAKRLAQIAKAEGVKPSREVKSALKSISELSEGSMRNAISHLEALLFAVAGGGDFSAEGAMTAYVESTAVDLDKAAASVVAATLLLDLPGAITVLRKANNARGILYKVNILVDYLIGFRTKTAKFTPYVGRIFADLSKKHNVKTPLAALLLLQQNLLEAEVRMNSTSIADDTLLQSAVAQFILDNR